MREYNAAADTDNIYKIIRMLKKDFVESTQANQRKGGLIGLAATAIGLVQVYISSYVYIDLCN